MPPLEGKVTGKSKYQSSYPPRLHSLNLCQLGCTDAQKGDSEEQGQLQNSSLQSPANFQQYQGPSLGTVFLLQPGGVRSREGAEGRRAVNWALFLPSKKECFL